MDSQTPVSPAPITQEKIISENSPENLPGNSQPQIPQNEIPGTPNAAKNSIVENIRAATASTVEKFKVAIKGKPGRPRKPDHELKHPRREKRPENPFSQPENIEENNLEKPMDRTVEKVFPSASVQSDNPFAANGNPNSDLAVFSRFKRSFGSLVKGGFAGARTLTIFCCDVLEYSPGAKKAIASELVVDESAITDVAEDLDAVLKKYNKRPEYMEEMALAGSSARLLAPLGSVALILWSEMKRKRAENLQQKPVEK